MVLVRGYGKQRIPRRPPLGSNRPLDAARAPTGHGFT
jgi:hypothetical protein